MNDFFNLSQFALPNFIRKRGSEDHFLPKGSYNAKHYRGGVLLNQYNIKNDITNEGKNKIFNVMFNDSAAIANNSWYLGLMNASGFSALAATDVMASHGGWAEFTGYTQANRVAWGSGTSTAQSVTNATPATFNINTSATLKGFFVVSNNTKGGTSGVLWSTAQFSADVPVVSGDEIKLTYTINS